jgi:hypothetical protein
MTVDPLDVFRVLTLALAGGALVGLFFVFASLLR